MDRGVIYIATGRVYVDEALISAASLKVHMPGLPITIFSNLAINDPNIDRTVRIGSDSSPPTSATKFTHIGESPYRETLYLDSDTYVCDRLDDLFVLLKFFDLAAAHSPRRAMHEIDGVPDSFPELNSGVILFRRCAAVQALFSAWADAFARNLELMQRDEIRWLYPPHKRARILGDQGAFREALYRSEVRLATLPPEYNCRFSAGGFVDGPVRILHGRGLDLPSVAAAINSVLTRRGHYGRSGRIEVVCLPAPSKRTYSFENIRYTLRRRGLRWTAQAGVRRLFGAVRSRG
jgi:hypothetical protein